MMAASVIRTWNSSRLAGPSQPCFVPDEEDELDDDCEEELRANVEDPFEDEDSLAAEADPYFIRTETTVRLLRFAELISGDVQRYFGRHQDADVRNVYEVSPNPDGSYAGAISTDEPEKLGPLAELFRETHLRKQGLPMIQRRLPRSFWTEPHPDRAGSNTAEVFSSCVETMHGITNTPTIASSNTPDFSDLLAHWTSERDNPTEFSCDYPLP